MAKRGFNRHALPAVFSYPYRQKIGLLGGSFNPAHDGHIALSKQAKQAGKMAEIWWLVSPQNPLKSSADMAEFDRRLAFAKTLCAPYPWIRVLALESQAGTKYSYDTIRFLKQRAPRAAFTWVMGSDNLVQFPKWYKAREMACQIPFMVVRRASSHYACLAGQGRQYFRRYHSDKKTPRLTLIHDFHDGHSGTALRHAGFWG